MERKPKDVKWNKKTCIKAHVSGFVYDAWPSVTATPAIKYTLTLLRITSVDN